MVRSQDKPRHIEYRLITNVNFPEVICITLSARTDIVDIV